MKVVLAFAFSIAVAVGQTPTGEPRKIAEVIDKEGWVIPGLNSVAIKVRGARTKEDGVPDGVRVDIIEPRSTGTFTLVFPVLGQPTQVEVRREAVEVTEIRRYSINGRIFLCFVIAEVIGSEKPGHVHAGSEWNLQFYDPDGVGRLTVMRYSSGIPTKLVVPEWVKNSH